MMKNNEDITLDQPRLVSRYKGNDNYGRPKSQYIEKILNMDDKALQSETYDMIYHSARCNNNPRADWHWMSDACYDVCKDRDGDIYKSAYDECYKNCIG